MMCVAAAVVLPLVRRLIDRPAGHPAGCIGDMCLAAQTQEACQHAPFRPPLDMPE